MAKFDDSSKLLSEVFLGNLQFVAYFKAVDLETLQNAHFNLVLLRRIELLVLVEQLVEWVVLQQLQGFLISSFVVAYCLVYSVLKEAEVFKK